MDKIEASKKAYELLEKIGDLNLEACSSSYHHKYSRIYEVTIEGKIVGTFPYEEKEKEIPKAGVPVEYKKFGGWQLGYSMGEKHQDGHLLVTCCKDRVGGRGQGFYVDEWRPFKTDIDLKSSVYYVDRLHYDQNISVTCADVISKVLDIIEEENNQ